MQIDDFKNLQPGNDYLVTIVDPLDDDTVYQFYGRFIKRYEKKKYSGKYNYDFEVFYSQIQCSKFLTIRSVEIINIIDDVLELENFANSQVYKIDEG